MRTGWARFGFLEAIRILGLERRTRFCQASTSELYGKAQLAPQSEKTPFPPTLALREEHGRERESS